MFKYTMKIKQYSPLIHFQANQYGATLRATELKPKLDKFLIKYAFKSKDEYKDFLIKNSNGKEALNYKVQINTKNIFTGNPIPVRDSLYFGNMETSTKIKRKERERNESNNPQQRNILMREIQVLKETMTKSLLLHQNNYFDIQFFSFYEDLLSAIEENIKAFLAVTNFGTRQNKGFGSFYIFDNEPLNFKEIKNEVKKSHKKFYYIKYDTSILARRDLNRYGSGNVSKPIFEYIMDDVDIIWKLMKSGINYPDHPKGDIVTRRSNASYHKGFLFTYLNSIGNEKRYIKQKILRFESKRNESNKNYNEYRLQRSVLGLAQYLEFRNYIELMKADRRMGTRKIFYNSKEFARIKAPVTFKIIDKYLFILPEEIPEEIFDKEIELYLDKFDKNDKKREPDGYLRTPTKDQFDLIEFMNAFVIFFNKELKVESSSNIFENKLRNAKQQTIEVGE